jgi:uncharacterized membrane protein
VGGFSLEPQLPHPNNKPQVQIIQPEFSGPLPPPTILAQYDRIVPGAAERIITMAEEQSRHRRSMESQRVVSDITDARLGLRYGLVIGLAAIIGGVTISLAGHPIVGTIFGGAFIVALVGTFVYGSQQRGREREAHLKR